MSGGPWLAVDPAMEPDRVLLVSADDRGRISCVAIDDIGDTLALGDTDLNPGYRLHKQPPPPAGLPAPPLVPLRPPLALLLGGERLDPEMHRALHVQLRSEDEAQWRAAIELNRLMPVHQQLEEPPLLAHEKARQRENLRRCAMIRNMQAKAAAERAWRRRVEALLAEHGHTPRGEELWREMQAERAGWRNRYANPASFVAMGKIRMKKAVDRAAYGSDLGATARDLAPAVVERPSMVVAYAAQAAAEFEENLAEELLRGNDVGCVGLADTTLINPEKP